MGRDLEDFPHGLSPTLLTLDVIILGEEGNVLLRRWEMVDVRQLVFQFFQLAVLRLSFSIFHAWNQAFFDTLHHSNDLSLFCELDLLVLAFE